MLTDGLARELIQLLNLHPPTQSGAAAGGQEGTIVPRGEEKGRGIPACPRETSADEFAKYARQESNL